MTEGPAERNPVPARPTRSQVPGFLKAVKFRWPELGWIQRIFLLVVALALGMRLWELGGRAMHYDEAIQMIIKNEIKALIADVPACKLAVFRYPDEDLTTLSAPLTVEPIGIAVSSSELPL